DEYVGARLDVAGDDIPGGDNQLVALRQNLRMRQSTRRNNDDIRVFQPNRVSLCPRVEMEGDTQLLTLAHSPVDDADHFPTARTRAGKPNLAPRGVRSCEANHAVTALAGHTRGFKPGRTGADDDDLLTNVGLIDSVRHGQLATRRGVVNTIGRAALVDTVKAV